MASDPKIVAREWSSNSESLPTKLDFGARNDNCLDELSAWRDFGGLTRSEVYRKFCSLPGYYQEHFMFMGGKAFAFYFPVIERYIIESSADDDEYGEVDAMTILACDITQQFKCPTAEHVRHLRSRILALAKYVRDHLPKFCNESQFHAEIDQAWGNWNSIWLACTAARTALRIDRHDFSPPPISTRPMSQKSANRLWQLGIRELLLLIALSAIPVCAYRISALPVVKSFPYASSGCIAMCIITSLGIATGMIGWYLFGSRVAFAYGYVIGASITAMGGLSLFAWVQYTAFLQW